MTDPRDTLKRAAEYARAQAASIEQNCRGWKRVNDGSYEEALSEKGYYILVNDAAALDRMAEQEPVAYECVYQTIIQWDEGGGKRSRRELARRIIALYAAPVVPAEQKWLPMETAPKDGTPILALCRHDADPEPVVQRPNVRTMLSLYAAHAEGMGHVQDGPHVLVWGGAFDDSTWETPGASLPDWWFQFGSDFEIAAYPIGWLPIPEYRAMLAAAETPQWRPTSD